MKMKTFLIQQKCTMALMGKVALSATMPQEDKAEMTDKAKVFIVFCLKDEVLGDIQRRQQ